MVYKFYCKYCGQDGRATSKSTADNMMCGNCCSIRYYMKKELKRCTQEDGSVVPNEELRAIVGHFNEMSDKGFPVPRILKAKGLVRVDENM